MDDKIREAIAALAERTGISAEEAAGRISEAICAARTSLELLAEAVRKIFDIMCGVLEAVDKAEDAIVAGLESKARRRRQARQRARRIEREYRAVICRCERQRFVRKVWRPPRRN